MPEAEPALVGEATPYFYIGDSHAMVGSLVFDAPADSPAQIVTVPQIIRGFAVRDMLDGEGRLGSEPVEVLRRISAFTSHPDYPAVEGLPVVHSTDGRARLSEHLTPTVFANERPYIFCVGEIDARYLSRWVVTENVDFDVPFATTGLDTLPAYTAERTYGVEAIFRMLAQHYDPLFRALRILHSAGLRSIFLHSLPPPTLDDEEAARLIGVVASAKVRYKMTMLVNFMYDAVCRDIGIGFVNTWSSVTENNILKPEYYLDGLHLNRKHIELSVALVHRLFSSLPALEPSQAG